MLIRLLVLLSLVSMTLGVFADNRGNQLLRKHAAKLAAAQSLNAEVRVTSAEDNYTISIQILRPDKVKLVTKTLVKTSDGTTQWFYYPQSNSYIKSKPGDPANVLDVDEVAVWKPFFKPKAFDVIKDATYVGMEKIGTTQYDVVRFTTLNKSTVKLYIDPATGIGKHADINVKKLKPLLVISKSFTLDDPNLNASMFAWTIPAGAKEVTEAEMTGFGWLTDCDKALAFAKQQRKPVLIDFYADWCHWCKVLDKDVFPTAEFNEQAKNFILLKVNGEIQASLAERFGISGYPTAIFVDYNGNVIHEIVGYLPLAGYIEEMKTALSKAPK